MRNREHPNPDIAGRLRRFADIAAPDSPLSAAFARAAADDDVCHSILGEARHSLPAANMLLAAVHFLLLGGEADPLAAHYPSVSATGGFDDGSDPGEAFLAFCRRHRDRLVHLVSQHGVQTNEVRRCVVLLPAFARVAARERAPLALLELGASAGLNLCFDRYRYHYGWRRTGPEESPLTLGTEVRSGEPIVPDPLPEVAWRAGVDLDPIDLRNESAVRWARALLWPEQLDRIERFDIAVGLARQGPPKVVEGEATAMLPDLVAESPDEAALLVFHSHVLNQMSPEERDTLDRRLRDISRLRKVDRISFEALRPEMDFPEVTHIRYRDGGSTETLLGTAHHHGAWIAWKPEVV